METVIKTKQKLFLMICMVYKVSKQEFKLEDGNIPHCSYRNKAANMARLNKKRNYLIFCLFMKFTVHKWHLHTLTWLRILILDDVFCCISFWLHGWDKSKFSCWIALSGFESGDKVVELCGVCAVKCDHKVSMNVDRTKGAGLRGYVMFMFL